MSKVSEAANRNENVMPLAWAKSGASLRLSRFYFRLSTNAAQNFLFDERALGVSVYLRECHPGTVLWIFRCDFATSEKGLGGAIWRGWECGRLQGTDGSFGWKSLGLSVISQRNMHGMWRLKRVSMQLFFFTNTGKKISFCLFEERRNFLLEEINLVSCVYIWFCFTFLIWKSIDRETFN